MLSPQRATLWAEFLVSSLLLAGAQSSASAQSSSQSETRPPIFAPPQEPSPPAADGATTTRPRQVTPKMAQWLAEVSPKYAPTTDAKSGRLPDSPVPNGVIRLPRYTIKDTKVLPNEEEVLSPKGETELAMHRYITEFDHALNFFTLPLFGSILYHCLETGQLYDEKIFLQHRHHAPHHKPTST